MGTEAPFRYLDSLFFGTPADVLEVHTLREGAWSIGRTDLHSGGSGRTRLRILGIEILDSLWSTEALEQRLDEMRSEDVCGRYIAISDRPSVPLVERAVSQLGIDSFALFGIDPDYYFGLVPVSGKRHRRVERWVLGLKPARGAKARAWRVVKRILIMVGQSKRLYEAFVIVLEA